MDIKEPGGLEDAIARQAYADGAGPEEHHNVIINAAVLSALDQVLSECAIPEHVPMAHKPQAIAR